MKIIGTELRAVIERVTYLRFPIEGEERSLYVFEHLDRKGVPYKQWIQNWETRDITDDLSYQERKEITDALYDYYKSKSNSSD